MARIALRSPIPLPPADATRSVGRFLYGDAMVQHTLAMLSLAPGPGPGGGDELGTDPAKGDGQTRGVQNWSYFRKRPRGHAAKRGGSTATGVETEVPRQQAQLNTYFAAINVQAGQYSARLRIGTLLGQLLP